jgi:hypothetical protein
VKLSHEKQKVIGTKGIFFGPKREKSANNHKQLQLYPKKNS